MDIREPTLKKEIPNCADNLVFLMVVLMYEPRFLLLSEENLKACHYQGVLVGDVQLMLKGGYLPFKVGKCKRSQSKHIITHIAHAVEWYEATFTR